MGASRKGNSGGGKDRRFRPHERLRNSAAYQRVRVQGKRRRARHFTINHAPNDLAHHRLGLVVPKRIWKSAVQRNRIKRRLREWFRLNKGNIPPPGEDIVIIARPGSERLSPQEMARELMPLLKKRSQARR